MMFQYNLRFYGCNIASNNTESLSDLVWDDIQSSARAGP